MDATTRPIKVTRRGETVWMHEPPERCPEGHPWAVGSGYGEGWYACWCAGAQQADQRRPGHHVFTCHVCNGQVTVPPCVDPAAVIGWAASHG
jgi:hypothetical protein